MSKIKGFDAGKIKIREIKALAGLNLEFSPFLDEQYKKEYNEKKLALLILELLDENIQNAKIFKEKIAKNKKSIEKLRVRKKKELSSKNIEIDDKNKEIKEIKRLVNMKELKNIGNIIDENKKLESENTNLKIENEKAKWAIDSVNNLTAERSKWLSKLKRAGIKV